MRPPIARKKPGRETLHNVTRQDDYAWLRDENWQAVLKNPALLAPDIRNYLEAENAYADAARAPARQLEDTLYHEMRARICQDDMSVPDRDGEFAYYTRQAGGSQYPVWCRCPASEARFSPEVALAGEEVLLDANLEASGHAYFHLGSCAHSPDHRYLAYCIDTDGSEFYTLRVIDLETKKLLGESIERIQADVVWMNNSRALVYVLLDDHHRPRHVALHRLDTTIEDDRVIYRESDPGFFVKLDKTGSRRFITIDSHDHATSEARLLAADDADATPFLVARRRRDVEYTVDERRGGLFILTNADGAEDYKLVTATPGDSEHASWQDLVVPGKNILLEAFSLKRDFLVRKERENGLPRLVVSALDAHNRITDEHSIEFAEPAHELEIVETRDWHAPVLRFAYTSMATPSQVFDYDMRARERVLKKAQRIPGYHPENYVTRRCFAPATDGETVPLSLLYKKDTPPGSDTPVLLYGYGAYGYSTPAAFSPHRLSLVDRGFTYAIAHVRGGMEKGHAWYRSGKLLHKQNTFSDFVAAADYLIREKFTRAGNIAIHGGSAGGLLIGAVLNQRPELFRAAVADVPFVDVLNTMCDGELPLTPPEWREWGNPLKDEAAYHVIRSYSPYDNVAAQDYPPILITAGVSDPRVTYWEPAKWTARLRASKTDDNLLLLKTNLSAGHGGASGRFDHVKEIATLYAFILNCPAP